MTEGSPSTDVCLIVGAGDALGGAIARRFAKGGYRICIARRDNFRLESLVTKSLRMVAWRPFALDVRRPEQNSTLFDQIERGIGPLDAVIFNVGRNVRAPLVETTAQKYFNVWEQSALAGFLIGQDAARRMLPRRRGTILFAAATAKIRGGPATLDRGLVIAGLPC